MRSGIENDRRNRRFTFREVLMKEVESEEVQRLIRLKRYETPGEEFYCRFTEEFKDRQRSELLNCSARSLLAERFGVWFDEWNAGRWLVPTGAAAAIGAGALLVSRMVDENVPAAHVVADKATSVEASLPRQGSFLPAGSSSSTLREL